MDARVTALVEVGRALQKDHYSFVTVTPETHRRVNARGPFVASSLRDVFGWSRPFEAKILSSSMLASLRAANALLESEEGLRSAVRFSTLGEELFVHSAYPTNDEDAVFFGPDTYRFCAAIERARPPHARRVLDIGCGSGAGGLVASRGAERVVLADVNTRALLHARVNAALGDHQSVEFVSSDACSNVEGQFDFIVANPPYMRDAKRRTYRDGGSRYGEGLSIRILQESLEHLAPRGTLLLYTGAVMIEGVDQFLSAASPVLKQAEIPFVYQELDPDVFGEELCNPGYEAVERIAAVVLTATRA